MNTMDRVVRWPGIARDLLLILVAFTILTALYNLFTPIFEAPDEVWHYAHLRWLAEGHGLPSLIDDRSGAYQEAAQPPLYYASAALLSYTIPDDDLPSLMWHNPGFGFQAPGTVADNKNMLIHTTRERWPWRGAVLAVHVARLTSWLYGLIAVSAAWGLGMETFGDRHGARLTAAWLAFHPQFVFISSVINNDAAATALATVVLWRCARALRRGIRRYDSLLLGMAVGLATLAKTSLLALIPTGLGAIALAHVLHRGKHTSFTNRFSLSSLASYLLGVAIIGGWWYARNWMLYQDPLGLSTHLRTPWGRPATLSLPDLIPEIPLVLRSFWAAYGWGHVTWSPIYYILLWTLALCLIAAALWTLGRNWYTWLKRPQEKRGTGFSLPEPSVLIATLSLFWAAAIVAALVHWMQQVEAPHGRLLFPALGSWGIVLTWGALELRHRSPRLGILITRGLLGLTATLSILAPGARIASTFSMPRLLSPSKITTRCETPVNLHYDELAQLSCLKIEPQRVRVGEKVAVSACWIALAPIERDYTVFVHILGPDMMRVGERHTYPGLGRYPTTLWSPGLGFCETYRVQISTWAEAPLRYQVEIGLFEPETGARLPVTDALGHSMAPPVAGHLVITPLEPFEPRPSRLLAAHLGEGIELLGADIPSGARIGDRVPITLYWKAKHTLAHDYVAFVHLWRPGDNAPLAQHDSQPRAGWYPVSAWGPNDVISDTHILEIPSAMTPGTYPLWAGLYDPVDGTRLAAYGPDRRYTDDLVPLGTIEVQSPP